MQAYVLVSPLDSGLRQNDRLGVSPRWIRLLINLNFHFLCHTFNCFSRRRVALSALWILAPSLRWDKLRWNDGSLRLEVGRAARLCPEGAALYSNFDIL